MEKRYFWLYSDGNYVKEITRQEYIEKASKELDRKKTSLLAWVDKSYVCLRKGRKYLFVPKQQLKEILKE